MNMSLETLKRISAREAWILAGFRPSKSDDLWEHSDGRFMTYHVVLTTLP
jgi:hypothetical protein